VYDKCVQNLVGKPEGGGKELVRTSRRWGDTIKMFLENNV
jgi:hypothetical protein